MFTEIDTSFQQDFQKKLPEKSVYNFARFLEDIYLVDKKNLIKKDDGFYYFDSKKFNYLKNESYYDFALEFLEYTKFVDSCFTARSTVNIKTILNYKLYIPNLFNSVDFLKNIKDKEYSLLKLITSYYSVPEIFKIKITDKYNQPFEYSTNNELSLNSIFINYFYSNLDDCEISIKKYIEDYGKKEGDEGIYTILYHHYKYFALLKYTNKKTFKNDVFNKDFNRFFNLLCNTLFDFNIQYKYFNNFTYSIFNPEIFDSFYNIYLISESVEFSRLSTKDKEELLDKSINKVRDKIINFNKFDDKQFLNNLVDSLV